MGWVVEQFVGRVRRKVGIFGFYDWKEFCDRVGLRIAFRELPPECPGLIFRRMLILDPRLSRHEQARVAWHELGHRCMHPGDQRDWLTYMACGDLIINKQERQADEFAVVFPLPADD